MYIILGANNLLLKNATHNNYVHSKKNLRKFFILYWKLLTHIHAMENFP